MDVWCLSGRFGALRKEHVPNANHHLILVKADPVMLYNTWCIITSFHPNKTHTP